MDQRWEQLLAQERGETYFQELMQFLESERAQGKVIYPAKENIFHALKLTSFSAVKVVILGQDPYHGAGQAHGLAFSVPHGAALPPSLKNIFKELSSDLKIPSPTQGNLEGWAKQGVLLLNTVLTVEEGKAGSHHGKGWEKFTDKIITTLNQEKENLVFILWGNPAQKKIQMIDPAKHHLICCVHPSPLSAHRGFFGSRPFSRANEFLTSMGHAPVGWERLS